MQYFVGQELFVEVLLDTCYNLGFSLLIAGPLRWMISRADTHDTLTAETQSLEIESRAQSTRLLAQRHANALVHDYIMSALVAVSSPLLEREEVKAAADKALEVLRGQTDEDADVIAARTLQDRIRRLPDTAGAFTVSCSGDFTVQIPAWAATAIFDAAAEAIRNSLRHARAAWIEAGYEGDPPQHFLDFFASDTEFQVCIRDNGPGYRPSEVPLDRLGVRSSILGRMDAISGGEAIVETSPGNGVAVTLRWQENPQAEPTKEKVFPVALLWRRVSPSKMFSFSHSLERPAAAVLGAWLVFTMWVYALATLNHFTNPILPLTCAALLTITTVIAFAGRKYRPIFLVSTLLSCAFVPGLGIASWIPAADVGKDAWPTTFCSLLIMVVIFHGYRVLAVPCAVMLSLSYLVGVIVNDGLSWASSTTPKFSLFAILVAVMGRWALDLVEQSVAAQEQTRARAMTNAQISNQFVTAQRQELARVHQTCAEVLEKLAGDEEITPELKATCRATEGALRDRIRSPRLAHPTLEETLRQARLEGAHAILTDASPIDAVVRPELLSTLAEVTAQGVVPGKTNNATIRWVGEDHNPVATVVARGEDYHFRAEIQPTGLVLID